MNLRRRIHRRIAQAPLALVALWMAGQSAGAITSVNLDVTPSGGNYHYEASIFNDEVVDLVLVSLFGAPVGDALITASLTAPVGFLASYDSGLGIIDFLGNTSDFLVGTTTSGFSFDSAFAPAGLFSSASSLDAAGNFFDTQVTVNFQSVPDTGSTLSILALSIGVLAVGRKRLSTVAP